MATIDKDLVRAINKGNCILLVGAGASASEGFPNWYKLTEQVQNKLIESDQLLEPNLTKYSKHLSNNELIQCFGIAENIIGKQKLVLLIKDIFNDVQKSHSEVYQFVTNWPFQFYLTTNFDSSIIEYLHKQGIQAVEKGNSLDDFRLLHNDAKNIVFKIHGDFSDYNSIIITENDYQDIRTSSKYKYWRDKIFSVLSIFNFSIIGYSAKDPNFIDQLNRAKDIADPNKPVFMFTTDIEPSEVQKLYEQNIRVIEYDNRDGNHSGLIRILRQYNHFLQKRNSPLVGIPDVDHAEAETASSIYFYNEVVLNDISIIDKALYNQILSLLFSNPSLSITEIVDELKSKKVLSDKASIIESINQLVIKKMITYSSENEKYFISMTGADLVKNAKANNTEIKDRFFRYCENYLTNLALGKSEVANILLRINDGLLSAFKKRGMEIAKMVFYDTEVALNSSMDFLNELNLFSSKLSQEEFLGFTDLLLEILQRPTNEVKDYLAILSNGYFTYHILGHEAEARNQRLHSLKNKELIIDSSILIPFFAKDCINNEFAKELISRLNSNGIKLLITNRLLSELSEHAAWALRHYKNTRFDELSFYSAALGIGCKQNLFIDGAMKWSFGKSINTFGNYMIDLFGSDNSYDYTKIFTNLISRLGISIIDMSDINEFKPDHYTEYENVKKQITKNRIDKGTYRSELQCETEAELVIISSIRPFNFLTHSSNLRSLTRKKEILHWQPETMYRFLCLNDTKADLSNLYSCMIGEFYSYGFNVVNSDVLKAFSSPLFSQARMNLSDQKRDLGTVIERFVNDENLKLHSDDFTLPFFPLQTALYAAKELKKQKDAASAQINKLEQVKHMSERERNEYLRLKSKKKQRSQKNKNKRKKKK
jgi:hypothetical protein